MLSNAQSKGVVEAQLNEVTVFKQGAMMQHKVRPTLPNGNSEIVIGNVANGLDVNSIQINAPSTVTVLSVHFSSTYDDGSNKVKEPNDELSQAERKLTTIVTQKTTVQNTINLLEQNIRIGGSNNGVTVTELSKMTDYYQSKQLELRKKQDELIEDEKNQIALINTLKQKYGVVQPQTNNTGGYIIMQVMTTQAITPTIGISYLANNASWAPLYDFKISNTSQPIQVVYKANITQTTGVAWNQVKLTLSNSDPKLGNIAPEIYPWFLSYRSDMNYSQKIGKMSITNAGRAIEGSAPGVQVTNGGGQPGAVSSYKIKGYSSTIENSDPLIILDGTLYNGNLNDIDPDDIAAIDVLKDATATAVYGNRGSNGVLVVTSKNKGVADYTAMVESELNVSFDIAIPYDILSNGKAHGVLLKDVKHPATYNYLAVPKMDKDAFLIAKITNFESLSLMPGEANIILDNTYLGKTYVNPRNTKDTLALSVGRDKKIIIERTLVLAKSSTKLIGNNRKQVFTYEIKIRNTKNETVQFNLKEPYPIATDNAMEVELLESDNASVDKEKALLTWDLSLKPNETKTYRISYSVKAPSNKPIGNL